MISFFSALYVYSGDSRRTRSFFETRIDASWVSTVFSSVLATFVYFLAAEQVAPAQQQNNTQNWRPVGKGIATDESGRGSAEERSTGRAFFCRLVRGIVWRKTKSFRKQQSCMFGSDMDEYRKGCV